MAKRFTDTNKYKKPFIRGLQGPYKLLWDYLYHDCDHAGIWIVDFEIAQVYLGQDMKVNKADALKYFNQSEIRIIEIEGGAKWFIVPFIDFQYGPLNEQNRAHNSVIQILKKYDLWDGATKGLISPLLGCKDKDKDKDKDKEGVQGEKKKGPVNYQFIVDNYHHLCPKMNKVAVINKLREGYINARIGEYGQQKVIEILRLAGESDFLNGKNDRAWKADLEWIMRPTNFIKIMEGKYSNNKNNSEFIPKIKLAPKNII